MWILWTHLHVPSLSTGSKGKGRGMGKGRERGGKRRRGEPVSILFRKPFYKNRKIRYFLKRCWKDIIPHTSLTSGHSSVHLRLATTYIDQHLKKDHHCQNFLQIVRVVTATSNWSTSGVSPLVKWPKRTNCGKKSSSIFHKQISVIQNDC